MTSRPRLRGAVAVGLSALGCAGLLGIDEDQKDVADEICQCPGAITTFGDTPCADYIAARLRTATPATRAAWMQKFDQFCAGKCNQCWSQVFFQRPTCTEAQDECVNPDCGDCCATTEAGSNRCAGDAG